MIEPVTHQTVHEWAKLASSVWSASKEQLIDGFYQEQYPYEFLYWLDDSAVGFISLSVRRDDVEGAVSRPVAFLEGIYVNDLHREKGLASELVAFAKNWASQKGLTQLASNTHLSNHISQQVHEKLGFQEVSRTVNYIIDCER